MTYNRVKSPSLELDVHISHNKLEKMVVYKNDNLEQATEEFSIKHNLNEEKKKLLLLIVKEEVSKILTWISEEEEDSWD